MFTDRYCPRCALKLREGWEFGEYSNFYICKNGHAWSWNTSGHQGGSYETLTSFRGDWADARVPECNCGGDRYRALGGRAATAADELIHKPSCNILLKS